MPRGTLSRSPTARSRPSPSRSRCRSARRARHVSRARDEHAPFPREAHESTLAARGLARREGARNEAAEPSEDHFATHAEAPVRAHFEREDFADRFEEDRALSAKLYHGDELTLTRRETTV